LERRRGSHDGVIRQWIVVRGSTFCEVNGAGSRPECVEEATQKVIFALETFFQGLKPRYIFDVLRHD